MRKAIQWMVPTLVLTLAACSGDGFFVPRTEVLGTLIYDDRGPEIDIQVVGRTVSLAVDTFGPPCWERGRLAVEVVGMEVTVTPYDLATPPDWDCERVTHPMHHAGSIELPGDGSARILVRGLHRQRPRVTEPSPIEFERIVQIGGG